MNTNIVAGLQKVKQWSGKHQNDLFVAALIFLVSMMSFGLGRLSLSWPQKVPITITSNDEIRSMNYATTSFYNTSRTFPRGIGKVRDKSGANPDAKLIQNSMGAYVASKSGSSYHFPWCPGALKIKEGNKIWFETREEAVSRGFKPAGNCPGL